jgi:hypothetical protein
MINIVDIKRALIFNLFLSDFSRSNSFYSFRLFSQFPFAFQIPSRDGLRSSCNKSESVFRCTLRIKIGEQSDRILTMNIQNVVDIRQRKFGWIDNYQQMPPQMNCSSCELIQRNTRLDLFREKFRTLSFIRMLSYFILSIHPRELQDLFLQNYYNTNIPDSCWKSLSRS